MKTIGMIGGMSWESTLEYYRTINQRIARALGGLHSARILLHSVDFAPIEAMMQAGEWDSIGALLNEAARNLESAGADYLLICTNTMHRIAPQIESGLSIPLIHIADAAGQALADAGISRVGLLGTRPTMEEDFYRRRMGERYGLEVLIPESAARQRIDRIIFDELCRGRTLPSSRRDYLEIIGTLTHRGAEAVLLGCTEIGLLIKKNDADVPLFDTLQIHAARAVSLALAETPAAEG